MQLNLSENQTLLKDTVSRLFRDESTPARIREAEANGLDSALWDKLTELGIPAMRMTSPDDGGYSLMDGVIVAEEAGRYLASAPVLEAIVANGLLARASAPADIIEDVESGAIATLALTPFSAGTKVAVSGAAAAKYVVGLQGNDLIVLRRDSSKDPMKNIAAANLDMIDIAAADAGEKLVLSGGNQASALWDAAVEEWKLLAAASLAGMGRKALELASEYACERTQFGKPIGTFQAISHPLADSASAIDAALLLTQRAVWSIAEGLEEASKLSALAYWFAGSAVEPAMQRSLRTFGGYGVSLEYDVQLYFRRAKYVSLLAGSPDSQLDEAAARMWNDKAASLPETGDVEIDFGFGAKAEAYAAELRAWVEANMTPEIEAIKHHSTDGHHAGFHKKLAEAGHAFPDFEIEGQVTRTRYEVMAAAPMWEDLNWMRTTVSVTEFVAKMCELWSKEEAKQEILPKIIKGDALGCLGFSEPASGSDVFGAKFSAAREGDGWVFNGQKMFTTSAHKADYILMLTRTDSSGRKHEGLTMFIIPLNVPGVEIHPVYTLQDERTNIVYFTDVQVDDKYRIGEVGDGARVMSSALGFEHGGASYHAAQTAMLKHAVSWAQKPNAQNGLCPIEDTGMRRILAKAAANEAAAQSLARREIWAAAEGTHNPYWGPMSKVFTTETMYEDCSEIVAAAAPNSLIRGLDHDMDIVEVTMRRSLGMTIYGGTSEIHRSLIAEKSLGLPKSRG